MVHQKKKLHVVVVGATGAVGAEVLRVLERRGFPIESLLLLASARSVGASLRFRGRLHHVQALQDSSFKGVDLAIFCAGAEISRVYAPIAKAAGAIVVDNSTAFRLDKDVPLVIPEINAEDIKTHDGIIANPNCTTAVTLMALYPLHREFGVKRIIASSYQAVSGAGAEGLAELKSQLDDYAGNVSIRKQFFLHQILLNVFPQVGEFQPSGYTEEEEKMQKEGSKIMHHPDFRASVTCVRVPVYRAHSVSVCAEFEQTVSVEEASRALSAFPGLTLVDDTEHSLYPTPLAAGGMDDCLVGRVRRDTAFDNGLSFFVSGDQLLKGAALNAVQIAEHVFV